MPEGDAIPRPALVIGLLALLPFLILLILAFSSPSADRFALAILSYGALLAAMLGGMQWALAAGPYGKARIRDEFLSGLAMLMAAGLSLVLPSLSGFVVLIAAFFLALLRDALMSESFPSWLLRLRAYVAAASVVSLLLALIRSLI
jgi:hypothetical protein